MTSSALDDLTLRTLDTWLTYQARLTDLPGFQVCIRKKGDILFNKAYGVSNVKTKRPLTTANLFHMASHSKSFTSCAILQLVEQGTVKLHQPAVDFLPELRNHKDPRFRQMTIRDLLSHRSGLFRDGLDGEFWALQRPFPSKAELLKEILASNLVFPPNTHTKYSNMGFSLLGIVLENVLSLPFPQIMDQLILKKLKGVTLLTDYDKTFQDQFTQGHSRPLPNGGRVPFQHAPANAIAPAGGFCGNAEDTSLFFDTLLRGKGLLSPAMQQELLTLNWPVYNTPGECYGLGLFFEKTPDLELVGHSGGYLGFSTYTARWVETDYVMSVFFNAASFSPLRVMRSLVQMFQKINETFTPTEAKSARVGGPFLSVWGTYLCVLTGKKGIAFALEDWAPCETALPLTSKNGKDFLAPTMSAFRPFGEKITFQEDKKGKLTSMQLGGFHCALEDTFIKNLAKVTA